MVKYITEDKQTSGKLQLAGLGMMLLGALQLVFAGLIVPLFTGLVFLGLGAFLWWDGIVRDYRDDRGRRLKRVPEHELPEEYRGTKNK